MRHEVGTRQETKRIRRERGETTMRMDVFYFGALCATVICPVIADERHLIKEGSNLTYKTNVSMDGNQILFTFENQNQNKTVFAQVFCTNGECLENLSDPRATITVGENTIFSLSNVNTSDSGIYSALLNGLMILWTLPVKVYASLAHPEITLEPSSQHCTIWCSVEFGENVTLSWYNTTSLVSDNSTLNCSKIWLLLEIKPDDDNNYTCVATNPVDNQTVILTKSCKSGSPSFTVSHSNIIFGILIVIGFFIRIGSFIVIIYRRRKKLRSQQPNRDKKEMKTFLSQDP